MLIFNKKAFLKITKYIHNWKLLFYLVYINSNYGVWMKCLSFIVLLIIFLKGHCVEQYCKVDDAEHCKERDEGYKYKKGIYFNLFV